MSASPQSDERVVHGQAPGPLESRALWGRSLGVPSLSTAGGLSLAFVGYLFLSAGYVFVKLVGTSLTTFEINFFVALFSGFVVILSKPENERWVDVFRMRRPWLTIGRSAAGIASGIFGVYAFSRIPFADAYTLLFLAPMFTVLLSIVFLRERVDVTRWVSLGLGAMGVVIAVRPDFAALEFAYLAAIAAAFLTSASVVALRSLSKTERHVSLVGILVMLAVLSNGLLMIPGFVMPSLEELVFLALAGFCSGLGTLAMIAALRLAPANLVAPTHYSQLVFAALFSVLVFNEGLDGLQLLGMGLIVISGAIVYRRASQPPSRRG